MASSSDTAAQPQTCTPVHALAACVLQGSRCAHKTLRAWEQDVSLKAKYWQKQKLARMAEYEDLQVTAA
jgi:hypothetical protein